MRVPGLPAIQVTATSQNESDCHQRAINDSILLPRAHAPQPPLLSSGRVSCGAVLRIFGDNVTE
jgi:hypothetical protein